MTDDDTLRQLLDAELDYSPNARSGFISHLAMGLIAAHRLGATGDELVSWHLATTNEGHLIERPRPAWLAEDTTRIAESGIETELVQRVPMLLHAPAAQFFHAMIRLDLAIDAGHPGQVANALANWEQVDRPLTSRIPAGGDAPFAEVLDRLRAARAQHSAEPGDLHEIADSDWFAQVLDELAIDDGLLDELSLTAARAHTDPQHFGTLHLVTGVRAAQAIAAHLDPHEAQSLSVRTAQAVAAALVSFDLLDAAASDARTHARRDAVVGWPEIGRSAIDSGDPHAVKLVYACALEHERTGDPIHHEVAQRQVAAA